MSNSSIFQDIAARTGGDVYLGVVGPVRTGKSTFIKRLMEQLVLPHISDLYRRQRATDELPQSGSGRTVMTSEPKFIPEEAVRIEPSPGTSLNVRLIDSVGYLIPDVVGCEDESGPRMVTTPWVDHEIPMAEAAELGTQKVMADHCTAGIVITTDGSITDFPRENYEQAEARSIRDMQKTGKPYLVLVNSAQPDSDSARTLCRELERKYNTVCVCLDCQSMGSEEISRLLEKLLSAFPARQMQIYLPGWLEALETDHPVKTQLYEALLEIGEHFRRISDTQGVLQEISRLDIVQSCDLRTADLGQGIVSCEIRLPTALFYRVLAERSGFEISGDGELVVLLTELARIKQAYDKVASALEQVQATGYGIVSPGLEDIQLTPPEIVKKGNAFSVRMQAQAPSIHMIRSDVQAEIVPMVGDAQQTKDLLEHLESQSEGDPDKLWQSNIFGRTVFDLVSDGIHAKINRMPEQARTKFKAALTKIINEGSGGMICILL